mgnify:FL=1
MNVQNVMRQSVRKSKYRSIKTTVDGITFDSKKEAKRYQELKLLQRANKIKNLRLQVSYVLIDKSRYGRQIKYIADFVYYDKELKQEVVQDTKGFRTDVYRLKKRLMAERYGIEIKEI